MVVYCCFCWVRDKIASTTSFLCDFKVSIAFSLETFAWFIIVLISSSLKLDASTGAASAGFSSVFGAGAAFWSDANAAFCFLISSSDFGSPITTNVSPCPLKTSGLKITQVACYNWIFFSPEEL